MNLKSGDIITDDFPAVTGVKRRPAVILSSQTYHNIRPDIIIGLITTQTKRIKRSLLSNVKESGIELSSPLAGYLGRVKGDGEKGDRFYYLRDLLIR
jgi:mRNA interferase MazF